MAGFTESEADTLKYWQKKVDAIPEQKRSLSRVVLLTISQKNAEYVFSLMETLKLWVQSLHLEIQLCIEYHQIKSLTEQLLSKNLSGMVL